MMPVSSRVQGAVAVLVMTVLSAGCSPRLYVKVRSPAPVVLPGVSRLAVLTFETRMGEVLRERARFELERDGFFTVVRMCGAQSCEPVDAFLRLYEVDVRSVMLMNVNRPVPSVVATVQTDVVRPDGSEVVRRRVRTREAALGSTAEQVLAERVVSELAAEAVRELIPPANVEPLVFDDAAPFKLAITQALEGRLDAARKTFTEMIEANPNTAGAYFNLGVVLEALGDLVGAKVNYERALELSQKPEYRVAFSAFERRAASMRSLQALPPR
jgi:tetratricopeptide (TPR) repeat protein